MRVYRVPYLCFNYRGGQGLRFRISDIIKWILAQVAVFQFYTPSSIRQYGVGNPNGALWTISMEIQFYIFVMLAWNYLRKLKKCVWGALIVAFGLVNIIFGIFRADIPMIVAKLINVTMIPYLYVFLIGMFAYAYFEDVISFLKKWIWIILVVYIAWNYSVKSFVSCSLGYYADIITGVGVCLITLGLSFKLGKRKVKYEISYGLYIYHMVVINAMVMLDIRTHSRLDAFIVLAASTILALLSYLPNNPPPHT